MEHCIDRCSFNEPEQNNNFSMALRDAGYSWATALAPLAPVISCCAFTFPPHPYLPVLRSHLLACFITSIRCLCTGDDNIDTQIVDVHRYSSAFLSDWYPGVYTNPDKGAVITEGGSRWYQPPYSSDQGSPLTAINFLSALAELNSAGKVPFVPGAMLSWEVYVGEGLKTSRARS
jgi:hypothetical protein